MTWSRRSLVRCLASLGGLCAAGRGLARLPRAPSLAAQQPVATTPASGVAATPAATPTTAATGLEFVREQRPTYPGSPRRGGELRLLRPPTSPDQFSPASRRHDPQIILSYLDPLIRPDPVTLEPGPGLAESWEWADDNQVLTFILRSDVTWHDGRTLTAEDVVFSFEVYRDDRESGVRNFFAAMVSAEAINDSAVRVTLSELDGGWVFNAATQVIIQRDQFLAHWESRREGERTIADFDWSTSPPLGTGPWKIVRWTESGIECVRYDGYWGDVASFDRMTLGWEESAEARLDAWRQGNADLLWPVDPMSVETVTDRPGRLYVADTATVMLAPFNFWNPQRIVSDFLLDSRLRQALSLAIDRDRYAADVFGTFIRQRAAGTIAQPWANDIELTTPRQDRETAQALLSEAGWFDLDGDGILDAPWGEPLILTVIVQEDAEPALLGVLESVEFDFAAIGVGLTIESLAADSFQERWTGSRNFDLMALSYRLDPGFTDFDLYGSRWDIRSNAQGFNPGGYANAEVDAVIADQRANPAIADQREALIRLQRAADEDLFALWFGFPRDLVLVAPDVLGYQPNKLWQTAEMHRLWRT